MPIDLLKTETKAKEEKVDFIIKIALLSIIMVICILVIIFLFYNTVAVIVGTASFFWLGYSLGKTWKSSNPKALFSKEYKGTVAGTRIVKLDSKIPKKRPTYEGIIAVRLENGELVRLEGLEKEATESYKSGDTVYHIAGTRYPLVTSRAPLYFPCPICGSMRNRREGKCRRCRI